ncbi:MAG TPA: NAD(P)H-hydrate dehydratase, partial [Candidatus Krumholzibacteria bacterium]|nr:NAD(P)H-hydrate dehydratase [Candidatus Krumholzibacteria bacterium]
HLVAAGWTCSLHLIKPGSQSTPDAAANYERLSGLPRVQKRDATGESVQDATVVIDAIFGTGFTGAPRGTAAHMIALINQTRAARGIPVVSIDIPSGVNGTTGAVDGDAVRADMTLTIGAAKTGLLFHPGRSHVGRLDIIDIGFPPEIVEKHSERVFYLDARAAASKLPPRAPDIHKYRAGGALVIAGSDAYRGAPLLTGEGALRSGCGMLYLAVPESLRAEIPAGLEEAIVTALPQTRDGTIAKNARDLLATAGGKATAVAIGPGLGRNDETDAFVRDFVVNCKTPIVVDADGLTAFAGHAAEFKKAKAAVVITPHDGELARLTGDSIPTTPLERMAYSAAAAKKLRVILVHKGAPALIAGPNGEVWVNGSGTSALSKGGTGDVLTGFIVSFLAQAAAAGRPASGAALDAACVACYLHGRAGEIEALERGERGVLASDLFASVGRAMVELESVQK